MKVTAAITAGREGARRRFGLLVRLRGSWSRTPVTALRRAGTHKFAARQGGSAGKTNYSQAQYLCDAACRER